MNGKDEIAQESDGEYASDCINSNVFFSEKRMDESVKLEGSYNIEGLYYGTHRFWNEHGQIMFEAEFSNGVQLASREFYNNGKIKFSRLFDKGARHGKHTCWYENGNIKEESSWVKGRRQGEFIKWHENGTMLCHKKFDRNRLVYLREWDRQANLIAQIG